MRITNIISMVILCSLLTSCSTVSKIIGKNSVKVEQDNSKIVAVQGNISKVRDVKLNYVSQFAFGVNASLDKITNKPIEVIVASQLNQRVQDITGLPTIEQESAMSKLVNDLIVSNVIGQQELTLKDNELSNVQTEEQKLISQKDNDINNALQLSKQTAEIADTEKSTLNEYQGWFGLKAIFMGIKQLLFTSIWFIVGAFVVYIVLRAAAASNPIANIAWGIFQSIGATAIHSIESLFPGSVSVVNQAKADVVKVSNVIDSIVNTIQPKVNAPVAPPVATTVSTPTTV